MGYPTNLGFPIMASSRQNHEPRAFQGFTIPWEMLAPHEEQAQKTHSQSLETLASRGGLSASEALAVLRDQSWWDMPAQDKDELHAVHEVRQLAAAWASAKEVVQCDHTDAPIDNGVCLGCGTDTSTTEGGAP